MAQFWCTVNVITQNIFSNIQITIFYLSFSKNLQVYDPTLRKSQTEKTTDVDEEAILKHVTSSLTGKEEENKEPTDDALCCGSVHNCTS